MARVTVEDCLDKTINRFSLVMLVSKRAKQMIKGAIPTVSETRNKEVVLSLREVAKGTVFFDTDATAGAPEVQLEGDLNR
ncbi:MAG: DNA-directed RNA polymerase subunit omega [Bdellovibrionales bacterium]